jgi:hypothetical protein
MADIRWQIPPTPIGVNLKFNINKKLENENWKFQICNLQFEIESFWIWDLRSGGYLQSDIN